mmetsp:Transcript_103508/g.267713  ORF Transcript_103508/g.267713 Transcript_103508/m.267713 type:complete len:484 (-) Transcript_103508:72-1523(-)
MNEGGGGGGPVVAALKPPVRILERNPLVVLHALKRSTAHLDQAPHVIGFQDGRNVIKLPNGASLMPFGPGALLNPRGVRMQLEGQTGSSQGAVQAGDHLQDYRTRTGDGNCSEQSLNALVRSRIWDIGFGPLGPAGALLADALSGTCRSCKGPPLVPSGFAATQRGVVHALVGDLRGEHRLSTCGSIRRTGGLDFDDGLTPQAVRLEFAARRLQAMGERRVALAGTSISPLDAWPKSVTSLADTWWAPYLRPAAMRVPPKAAKRKLRQAAGTGGEAAAHQVPTQPSFDEQAARAQAEAEMQMQYEAQMSVQDAAEREARREAKNQTNEWLTQAWLISNVRSSLYFGLQCMNEEEDDVPLLRVGLNSVPSALPRHAPQDSFVAGWPDAVQEIYAQTPLELTAIPEGLMKPTTSAELQLRGPDGEQKRPTLTAQVTRIRGSAASAFGFQGVATDIGPALLPLTQTFGTTGSGLEAPTRPTSALAA